MVGVRCVLIYNPAAGANPATGVRRERRADEIGRAAARLRSLGHEATTIATEAPGSAAEQARAAVREGAEVVFACGGDGTVHEVMQGLVAEDCAEGAAGAEPALGILPMGSANVLARHLGISRDAERAVEEQVLGERRRIAVGRIEIGDEVRYFAAMAGAGPDGTLAYELGSGDKARLGRLAYYLHAARIFASRRFAEFELETTGLDGTVRSQRAVSVMAARVRSLGGIFCGLVERRERMDGPEIELSLLRGPAAISLPLWFLSGWLRLRRWNPFLREMTVREFSCRPLGATRVHCEADGEYLGPIPMRVSVVPNALTVLVPRR